MSLGKIAGRCIIVSRFIGGMTRKVLLVFSSTIFLFGFLPLFLAVYFLMPWRPAKNVFLLLASLVFYAWGEPVYVLLMMGSIVFNWLAALLIRGSSVKLARKAWLAFDLVANIAVLGFFKYADFAIENVNAVIGEQFLASLELDLPIGISFFTLQAISYVVDVYRDKVKAQPNILYLGMYIAMFPQLVAGPIVRYSQIEEQIGSRRVTLVGFAQGLRLFIIGLGKKALLANTIAILADDLLSQGASAIGFVGCLSGVLAYTFQIYFDFSGYSDMAIGLGKMMGFDYPRNFNYPYASKSVTEFWRRWHMTLGSFFRDYVYIPLGGNRVSVPRWVLNIFIVWGLTGIWHGAAWNFLIWGLYYGFLLMLEKLFLLRRLQKLPKVIQHLYCVVAFLLGWLLFSLPTLRRIGGWTLGLFGYYGLFGSGTLWGLESWMYVPLLPVFVIGCLPVFPWLRKRVEAWASGRSAKGAVAAPEKGNDFVPPCQVVVGEPLDPGRARAVVAVNVLVDVMLVGVFVMSAVSIVSGTYNPFIYFQF